MKAKILDITGKEKASINLPRCFGDKVREDVVCKVIETKKTEQPYAPSLMAGNQSSASGKIVHKRHAWKSQYGRGMSRIPRKTMSRRGTQFHWVGTTVPNARGGRRAHPPRVEARINTLKINKKELELALISALSATTSEKWIKRKYETLRNEKLKLELPVIVESKILGLKVKDTLSILKKILGKELEKIAFKEKKIRCGKGKARGRKYKSNAGLLLVVGNDEKLKTGLFDISQVKTLNVAELASGGVGRLTVYTEKAIKDLEEKFK